MIVLVTGGRGFSDTKVVRDVLGRLDIDLLIQGGATGADREAKIWADLNGIHHATIPALWDFYNRHPKAGPIRNSVIAKLNIDLCVAFPGGRGTADMVKKCKLKGIEVIEITNQS